MEFVRRESGECSVTDHFLPEQGTNYRLKVLRSNGETVSAPIWLGPTLEGIRFDVIFTENAVQMRTGPSGAWQFSMHDLNGREIYRVKHALGPGQRFWIPSVPKGVYVIQFEMGGLHVREKVLNMWE
ncbi:MAG: T9SS type A sorting domain-containing protein [Bacteroidota bacterium]